MTKKIIYTTVALILLPVLLGLRVMFYLLRFTLKIIALPFHGLRRIFQGLDHFIQSLYEAYQERCFRHAVNAMICSNDVLGYTYRQTVFHELD